MHTAKKLSRLLETAKVVPCASASRIAIMSDCHRGDGSWGDNFLKNQHLFFAALTYYFHQGYTYIELGDGDELWENRNVGQIVTVHSDVFRLLAKFHCAGRFHMVYGNHDMAKKSRNFPQKYCQSCYNDREAARCARPLFPGLTITEAILLKNAGASSCGHGADILLVHGHQGDLLNDFLWKMARTLVRYVWKPIELLGFNDPTSAARNYQRKEATERRLSRWSARNRHLLIAGHTHRPSFPRPGESRYFNCGSCVHPRCVTALEIVGQTICLVKWTELTRPDMTLYVAREPLGEPVPISDYLEIARKY